MNLTHQIPFTVACSIGDNRIVARAVIDKKNNSTHLHLYGEMFGSKQVPMQVKNSDMKFIEGKEAELITQVLTDHFLGQPFQVKKIERLNFQEELSIQGDPLRIIIRLRH